MKLLIVIVFFFGQLNAQQKNIIIADGVSKRTIPYVNIKVLNTNKGFYANDIGNFTLLNVNTSDSLKISCLGYKSLLIPFSIIKDTIFLVPKTERLDEIKISSKRKKLRKIGFKRINSGWFGTQNLQIGVVVKPTKKFIGNYLQKIVIPFRKKIYGRKKYKYKSVFKISVFSVYDEKPDVSILDKPIIISFNQDSKKFVEVDVSKEDIQLKGEGIFICVEHVGEIDEKGDVIEKRNPLPGLGFSTIKPKEFEYINSFFKPKHSVEWLEMEPKKIRLDDKIYLGVQLIISNSEE
jgi:hypothetical protein